MLADELPNGRLLEANSIFELRLAPERLTGEIADVPRRVLAPADGQATARAHAGRAPPDRPPVPLGVPGGALAGRVEPAGGEGRRRQERLEREQAEKRRPPPGASASSTRSAAACSAWPGGGAIVVAFVRRSAAAAARRRRRAPDSALRHRRAAGAADRRPQGRRQGRRLQADATRRSRAPTHEDKEFNGVGLQDQPADLRQPLSRSGTRTASTTPGRHAEPRHARPHARARPHQRPVQAGHAGRDVAQLEALLAESRRLPHAALPEHHGHGRAGRRHRVGPLAHLPGDERQGVRRDADVPRAATSTRAPRASPRPGSAAAASSRARTSSTGSTTRARPAALRRSMSSRPAVRPFSSSGWRTVVRRAAAARRDVVEADDREVPGTRRPASRAAAIAPSASWSVAAEHRGELRVAGEQRGAGRAAVLARVAARSS